MKINTKSKNFQAVLFSVVGLVVLALVTVVMVLTAPKEENGDEGETTTTVPLLLQPEGMGAVTRVEVENSLGSFAIYSQTQGDEVIWRIEDTDIDDSFLSQSTLGRLASSVTDMTARSLVEENASDLSQYGFDNPEAKARIVFEQGEMTVKIGITVPGSASNYIITDKSNDVYSYYYTSLNGLLSYDKMSFVNTVSVPEYDNSTEETVEYIKVVRKDWEEPLILEEIPTDEDSTSVFSYSFTSPFTACIDFNTGNSYLNAMFGLYGTKAAYVKPSEEELELTGLKDPFCIVEEKVGNEIFKLYIGNSIAEKYIDQNTGGTYEVVSGFYGYSNQVPDIIFIFNSSDMIWATMEPTDYISELFMMPYIYDVEKIDYKDGGNSFTAKIEGDQDEHSVYLNGSEYDFERFQTFYQYIVGIKGKEIYTDEDRGDLIAEFTYTYGNKERTPDTVSFYEAEGRNAIIAVNGKNLFKTNRSIVTRLAENAEALLNGGEIILTI